MDEEPQPAELRTDYRFFRFVARFSAQLTVAGLVFALWHLIQYRDPLGHAFIFLLATTAQALVVSLVAGIFAYVLFKRRGGRIEKTPPPPGMGPHAGH